jgi:molecular chaperone DnaK (HSP70)
MFIPSLALWDEKLFEQQITGKEAYTQYYKTEQEGRLLARFKLLLDNYTNGGWEDISALEAISSYLKSLHKVILEKLRVILKDEKNTKYRYCLTVPAIWGDSAKRLMRQAIVAAGIIKFNDHPDRLMLINEPEAAAQFYARDPEVAKSKEKTRMLICDAGGGTVDMAVYDYIKQRDGSYTMEAITAGTGKICGSSFLDDNFRRVIVEKCNRINYIASPYTIEQMVDQFTQRIKVSLHIT